MILSAWWIVAIWLPLLALVRGDPFWVSHLGTASPYVKFVNGTQPWTVTRGGFAVTSGLFYGGTEELVHTTSGPGASITYNTTAYASVIKGRLSMPPNFTPEDLRTRSDLISFTMNGEPLLINATHPTYSATVYLNDNSEDSAVLKLVSTEQSTYSVTVTLGPAFEGTLEVREVECRVSYPATP